MNNREVDKHMANGVNELFERYQNNFQLAITSGAEWDTSLYASEFIAATPAGVVTGKNDERLKEAMRDGFEYYRQIGTKDMFIRGINISAIDERHCVAHVAWTAVYTGKQQRPEITIDFDVHYLVQELHGALKIFGWVSGDEQAALKRHGVI